MKGGLGNIMKQAQQMQENMQRAQEELASLEVTGESGGGLVKVAMTCRYDVRRVDIDADLVDPDDKDVLEDLVAAAMNDAVRKIEQETQNKMGNLAGGLNIPGIKMPF